MITVTIGAGEPAPPSESWEKAGVEITEEMVEAGLKEYALWDSQDPGEHVVCAIFSAMSRAKLAEQEDIITGAGDDLG